ncbi:MAG: flagellar motor switch protein FliN [Desulfatirhabdiaceae bacterium]
METIFTLDIKKSITKSVLNVFSTMLSLEIEPIAEDGGIPSTEPRIVGSVNFAGQVSGIININVPNDFALVMTTTMLGMTEEELEGDDEIKDVISEISNIIGGNVKSFFNDAGFYCALSTPSLTKGDDFKIKALNTERDESLSFRYQQHKITIEVGVKLQTGYKPVETIQGSRLPKIQQLDMEKIQHLDIPTTVIDSVVNVFDTMLSMKTLVADTVSATTLQGMRTVGSVSFAGDAMGLINIHVTSEFSRKMASVMLDMDISEVDEEADVNDVIGELSNIIGGNLKSIFTDASLRCELSTPSITRGSNFSIETMNMELYERLAFDCMGHTFFVEFGLKIAEGLNIPLNRGRDVRYQIAVESQPLATVGSLPPVAVDSQSLAATTDRPNLTDTMRIPDSISDRMEEPISQPEPKNPVTQPDPNSIYGWIEQVKSTPQPPTDVDLSFLLDIPLEISIQLGKTKMKINDLLKIREQSVVGLDNLADEPVEILVTNKLIAKGEVIVEGGKYGIRVIEVLSRADRIKSLR